MKRDPFVKIALFSSQSFSELSTPTYLGPEFVMAIAYGQDWQCFSSVEISAQSKNNLSKRKQIIEKCLEEALAKLPADHKVKTYLSNQKIFRNFRHQSKKFLNIPQESTPPDLLNASQFARQFFTEKLRHLKLEFPQIPFHQDSPDEHLKELQSNQNLSKLYDLNSKALASGWQEITRKKKMLLHICCGPDAAGVIQQLKEEFELLCFWYDPNIQPRTEHDLRLEAFIKVAEIENVPYLIGEYDVEHFLQRIKGLEHTPEQGAKCSHCYDMRLERSAQEAQKQNCDLYSSTLAISPHKVQQKLKNYGELFALKYKVPYYARNFMKEDGFKESVQYTKTWDIYRQDYCGCWFSLHEGGPKARQMAQDYALKKSDLHQRNYQLPE